MEDVSIASIRRAGRLRQSFRQSHGSNCPFFDGDKTGIIPTLLVNAFCKYLKAKVSKLDLLTCIVNQGPAISFLAGRSTPSMCILGHQDHKLRVKSRRGGAKGMYAKAP